MDSGARRVHDTEDEWKVEHEGGREVEQNLFSREGSGAEYRWKRRRWRYIYGREKYITLIICISKVVASILIVIGLV